MMFYYSKDQKKDRKKTNLDISGGDLQKLLLKVRESVVENGQTPALPKETAGERQSVLQTLHIISLQPEPDETKKTNLFYSLNKV